MMLISPKEHKKVKILVTSSIPDVTEDSLVDDFGADFMLITNKGLVLIQRKKFPSDFLASVADGRLSSEIVRMREGGHFQIILSEGKPRYNKSDRLLNGRRPSKYSRAGFRNLCRSIEFVEGCYIAWSDNLYDTVKVLKELQGYFDKSSHSSLHTRTKIESEWYVTTEKERYLFFLQGLPGVKTGRAIDLAKVFKSPIEIYNAEVSDFTKIPGFGRIVAERIYKFLRKEVK